MTTEGRPAQKPARSGLGTVMAAGGATGVGALLVYLGVPVELAGTLALVWLFVAGTVATWARDEMGTRNEKPLHLRLLSGLGLVVLAVGVSGCSISLGPDGEWYKGGLADGFCLEAHIIDQGGSFGHCAEEDPNATGGPK